MVVQICSQNEPDIHAAYELQANCYVSKPADFDEFVRVVKTIEELRERSSGAGRGTGKNRLRRADGFDNKPVFRGHTMNTSCTRENMGAWGARAGAGGHADD